MFVLLFGTPRYVINHCLLFTPNLMMVMQNLGGAGNLAANVCISLEESKLAGAAGS